MKFRTLVSVLALVVLMSACKKNAPIETEIAPVESVKPNIILIIGDGTGLSQISSLWYLRDQKPNYERFEYVGLSKTNSSSHKITDSGAGATAFAIGEKSYNGSIGVGSDSLPRQNLVEILSPKGYNSGVVSTSSITHATPASFYAHVKSRREENDIARQLAISEIDFFAGGGTKFFKTDFNGETGFDLLVKNGFQYDTLNIETPLVGDKIAYLLAHNGMPKVAESNPDFLIKATQKAIAHLDGLGKPFFLMIEGSQVDWGGHANEGEYVISELEILDKTIGIALDFAEKNGNTIVVALADHETGGFALSPKTSMAFGGIEKDDYNNLEVKFTTKGHTASHIPVFAWGVKANTFSGVYENNTIFNKILAIVEN